MQSPFASPPGPLPRRLIISCEHGGNCVPPAYARLFRGWRRVLNSHRGYDPGALELAEGFARQWAVPLVASTTTRLLVELNRSRHHPALFSPVTAGLPPAEKIAILNEFYVPYRRQVESWLEQVVGQGERGLHLSVHSFAPVFQGEVRGADVGLLYDPSRPEEQVFCHRWRAALRGLRPDLKIRRNYPYRGQADGLTTYLRRRFAGPQYAGIELEVNQRWPLAGGESWQQLQQDLIRSLPGIGDATVVEQGLTHG